MNEITEHFPDQPVFRRIRCCLDEVTFRINLKKPRTLFADLPAKNKAGGERFTLGTQRFAINLAHRTDGPTHNARGLKHGFGRIKIIGVFCFGVTYMFVKQTYNSLRNRQIASC